MWGFGGPLWTGTELQNILSHSVDTQLSWGKMMLCLISTLTYSLLTATLFIFGGSFEMILLLKMRPQHSPKVLSDVSKHQKAVICLICMPYMPYM